MWTINGRIDVNDLKHIQRLGYNNILFAEPCPLQRFGKGKYDAKINPHVTRFTMMDGRKVSVFHIKPIYYLHKNGQWRPMDEVAYGFGNHWINLKEDWDERMDIRYLKWLINRIEKIKGTLTITIPIRELVMVNKRKFPIREGREIFFTTSTFYPAAGANTPVDGSVGLRADPSSWDSLQGATDGDRSQDSLATDYGFYIRASDTADKWREIDRGIFLFDISSLEETITGGTFSIYGYIKVDVGPFNPSLNLVSSNPASTAAISKDDYNQFGTTVYSTKITYANLKTSEYNSFVLNTDGVNFVKAAQSGNGIVKFGLREAEYDIPDIEPEGLAGDINHETAFYVYCADEAGTDKDPKLVVVHVPAPPAVSPNYTSRKNYNGYLAFTQQFIKHRLNNTSKHTTNLLNFI